MNMKEYKQIEFIMNDMEISNNQSKEIVSKILKGASIQELLYDAIDAYKKNLKERLETMIDVKVKE